MPRVAQVQLDFALGPNPLDRAGVRSLGTKDDYDRAIVLDQHLVDGFQACVCLERNARSVTANKILAPYAGIGQRSDRRQVHVTIG